MEWSNRMDDSECQLRRVGFDALVLEYADMLESKSQQQEDDICFNNI